MVQVEEMTPTEADVLLAERLLERRSRAGSVLSDEQAQAGRIAVLKHTLLWFLTLTSHFLCDINNICGVPVIIRNLICRYLFRFEFKFSDRWARQL